MPSTTRRPRKSLRTLLIIWFLSFSIVPLAFLTGYSLVKYEQALDQELSKRLYANSREVSVMLTQFQETLRNASRAHASDRRLIYDLTMNNIPAARAQLKKWLQSSFSQRIWLYNRDARLDIALYKDSDGEVKDKANFEGVYYLQDTWLKKADAPDEYPFVRLQSNQGKSRNMEGTVDLVMFSKVKASNGKIVGFLEEALRLDDSFLQALKNRMNVEIFFFQPGKDTVVATHDDLALHKAETFDREFKASKNGFFEMNIRDNPYRFMLMPVSWGQESLVMGIGASKSPARAVLQNVNDAFIIVVGTMIIVLIVISVIMSRVLLRPVYDVLEAIEHGNFDRELVQVPASSSTELGLLAESFNELARRTFESQKALRDKVSELEKANQEIRETQARLVHAAKMAGLGQLVAGVAHELNNPIGFIYSNMSSLRDYSHKLLHLVKVAEEEPEKLDKEVKKADLEYIEKDLPKLISSCEDGARRTRDIVIGLRNFSRLEESQLKLVDIHEGLDNTLRLLTGELKNRVQVHKDYGKIPKINCYSGELNQVFMNILSNASQAIEGDGEIFIATKMHGKEEIEISIRDTGKGMSKATLDKIFDPFFTTKATGQGTGLGMSISYSVIQKHGGEIVVDSEPHKGSEFKIILPVKGPSA